MNSDMWMSGLGSGFKITTNTDILVNTCRYCPTLADIGP